MSMSYIRKHYGVPAKRGMRVRYTGDIGPAHVGTIVGSRGAYLRVCFPTFMCGGVYSFHPTWELEYLPEETP